MPNENILLGITRKKVLEIVEENYLVEEQHMSTDEFLNAGEAF